MTISYEVHAKWLAGNDLPITGWDTLKEAKQYIDSYLS